MSKRFESPRIPARTLDTIDQLADALFEQVHDEVFSCGGFNFSEKINTALASGQHVTIGLQPEYSHLALLAGIIPIEPATRTSASAYGGVVLILGRSGILKQYECYEENISAMTLWLQQIVYGIGGSYFSPRKTNIPECQATFYRELNQEWVAAQRTAVSPQQERPLIYLLPKRAEQDRYVHV